MIFTSKLSMQSQETSERIEVFPHRASLDNVLQYSVCYLSEMVWILSSEQTENETAFLLNTESFHLILFSLCFSLCFSMD